MKKLLALIISFWAGVTVVSAQNTFPTTGNVGIGTTAPNAWFPGRVIEIKDVRPIIRLSPTVQGELGTILFKGGYGSNTIATPDEFHLNYVSSLTNPAIKISSYLTGVGVTVFSILGNGNVGIGVENPSNKLAVNGLIRANEVRVENPNWPDYVFASNYELESLPNIERYIRENSHLPGVPSAKEISTNGIHLGEMNALLLKKIEELTLHMIEKDKKIRRLHDTEARLSELEKKLQWILDHQGKQ